MAQQNQQPQDMISRAAMLYATIQRCEREGKPLNQSAVRELQQIDSKARSTLNPQQYNRAIQLMQQQKHSLEAAVTQNEAQQADFTMQNALANQLRQSTEGLSTGALENFEQFQQVRNGETIEKKTVKNRMDTKALAKQVKKKFGTSMETHLDRLDEAVEASQSLDPNKGQQVRERYGFDEATVKDWKNGGGIDYTMNAKMAEEDKDLPETEEMTPTDDDIRHVDMQHGFAEANIDPTDSVDSYVENNTDLLNEDSRHGDIARSMMQHED